MLAVSVDGVLPVAVVDEAGQVLKHVCGADTVQSLLLRTRSRSSSLPSSNTSKGFG